MTAVLLTGGSGLLAVNWAMSMRDRHRIVLGIHERDVRVDGTGSRRIDLGSVDSLMRSLDAVEPGLVVHAAGLTSVEQCEANPELAEYVNVTLAGNVAEACAARGVRFAYISTDHLYSGDASFVDESVAPNPVNRYGQSKARAEQIVAEHCADALIVRTNFYGWGTSYRRSFSDSILDSLRQGRALNLFRDVFFTPILAEPLAQTVHDLVERGASGVFNVVGDERLSKHEFGLRLAAAFAIDTGLISSGALADRAGLVRRPYEMSLSNKKAAAALGRPLGGVDAHLKRLVEQEQSHIARELRAL